MIVVCVNDKHRPNEIKDSNWIKQGKVYNVAKLKRSVITGEKFYELVELKPDAPYGGYKIQRFAIPLMEIDKFCKMFNVDIDTDEELLELLTEKGVLEEEYI